MSLICPACGEKGYKGVRPEKFIAFSWDRVCKSCGIRYTPPTPIWAAIVFIFAGVLLAGFGAVSIVIRLASVDSCGIPAMACEGFLGLLGVLAIIHGIRTYDIDGDTLKVCFAPEGRERPMEFSTIGGTEDHPIMLNLYRRQKVK